MTLRSRLWLSYALLILMVLGAVLVALLVSLRPVLSRQTVLRLVSAAAPAADALRPVMDDPVQRAVVLNQQAASAQTRLILLDGQGSILADSEKASAAAPQGALTTAADEYNPRGQLFLDQRGRAWLYVAHPLPSGALLVAATRQPRLLLRAVLRDEVYGPVVRVGVIGLIIAFLFSLWMAGWVTQPLKKLIAGAQAIGSGDHPTIPVEGPAEVQALAGALNEMSRQVQAGRQSQRDFVANVSHELKTPLTSIQGFAQAILDGAASTPEALQQAARVIYDESERMRRLVMDLLTLARLEGGMAELDRKNVDLPALLEAVRQRFLPQAAQAGVQLDWEIPTLPQIQADGDRLAQVFNNLVDNAIKFTPSGGWVRLTAGVEQKYLVIRVIDSGPGITAQDRDRIFERFYQADRSRKGGTGRGAGLGLAIAREIVLAHGGNLLLDEANRQGAAFMVQLPLAVPRRGA